MAESTLSGLTAISGIMFHCLVDPNHVVARVGSTGRPAARDSPTRCCRTSRPSRRDGPLRRGRSCPFRCTARPGRSPRRIPSAPRPRIPGCCAPLSWCCSSALDEHPIAPTLPLDHGCDVIHLIVSKPSSAVRTRNVYVPSEKKRPRSYSHTTAYPCWRKLATNGPKKSPKWCTSIRYGIRIITVGQVLPRLALGKQDEMVEPHAVAHRAPSPCLQRPHGRRCTPGPLRPLRPERVRDWGARWPR